MLTIKLFVVALVDMNVPVPGFQTLLTVIVVVPNPTTFVPVVKIPDKLIESPILIPIVVPMPIFAIIVEPELTYPPKSVVTPAILVVPNPTILGKLTEEKTTGLSILSTIVSPTSKFCVPLTPKTAKVVVPEPIVPKNSRTIFEP